MEFLIRVELFWGPLASNQSVDTLNTYFTILDHKYLNKLYHWSLSVSGLINLLIPLYRCLSICDSH